MRDPGLETRWTVLEEEESRFLWPPLACAHIYSVSTHTDIPVHTHIHIISVTMGRSCVMEYRDLCFVKNIISLSEWVCGAFVQSLQRPEESVGSYSLD